MQKQYANADKQHKNTNITPKEERIIVYYVALGQLQHSAVNYFCIISSKLCN